MNVDANRITLSTPAANLNSLVGLQNDEFVKCAYITIFNRAPDADGLAHYLQRLQNGHPKIEILGSLYASDEARAAEVQIPWLRRAIFRHKLAGLPLVRIVRRLFTNRDRQLQFERRLGALERQLISLSQQSVANFGELSVLTMSLRRLIDSGEREMHTSSSTPYGEAVLFGKSLVAKRIFRELSDAIDEANRTIR